MTHNLPAASRARARQLPSAASWRRWAAALCLAFMLALACLLAVRPASVWAADAADAEEVAASADDDAGIGLTGFVRYNRGAQRAVDGTDIGYRFPVADGSNVIIVHAPDRIWVHVDADAADAVGFSPDDDEAVSALTDLIFELDETCSRGGELLSGAGKDIVVTIEDTVDDGAYRYVFALDVSGSRYTSVQPAGLAEGQTPSDAAEVAGLDLGDGALWVDDAALVAADQVAAPVELRPWESALNFFSSLDSRPFWVSLKTSMLALAITFVLGLFAAWRTMGTSSRLKGLLDSVFTIPMVLPPTVCGFLLLLVFGQSTQVGRWLIAHGISLVFTWPAAVISAIVVSFPLMYRTALGAFEGLDSQMLDAARTLGWSEGRIFRRLMLPLAWPSIAAGTVLAFARAMGEFGCTLFFAGNYAGVTQTIPIAIYFQWMSGNTDVALFWVVVVIAFSFLIILIINVYSSRSQRYRSRGDKAGKGGEAARTDSLEEHGGDALRIDRDALSDLLLRDAREGGE